MRNTIQSLVSVTFRQFDALKILEIAHQNKCAGIEWGADVHLKPGDYNLAEAIRKKSAELEIIPISYASYYKAGVSNPCDFDIILNTAEHLGTSRIRVWAGQKDAEEMGLEEELLLIQDLKRIAALAQEKKICVGIEYHSQTFTNSASSTKSLFEKLEGTGIYSYWQPNYRSDLSSNIDDIKKICRWIQIVHCFHWTIQENQIVRHPLLQGALDWKIYLQILNSICSLHAISLEFVQGDCVNQFQEDRLSLESLLN